MTILDLLENAQFNLKNRMIEVALEQLSGAIILLNKGYSVYTKVETLIQLYGSFDKIPEVNDE